ncbi:MAG TPA: hypothetical protein VGP11_04340 [Acidimicrobiales bacterium]|nr:hypothetical protein [Acidimicrobiales bacterium]
MLLIVLALIWVALLAPVVIRRLREGGAEKSIQSFHAEHEVLSRQDYTILPAHRLDEPDEAPLREPTSDRRPRLTVVHPDDTFAEIESRTSWDEWSEDYEYDEEPAVRTSANHYARAYSTHPREVEVTSEYEPPIRRRSMRAQRRVMFTRLVFAAALLTIVAFFTSYSPVIDVAALAWFAVVVFVALALYSVSQGYLSDASLKPRLPQRRTLATVKPLYRDVDDSGDFEDELDAEVDEPDLVSAWYLEPERHRALG